MTEGSKRRLVVLSHLLVDGPVRVNKWTLIENTGLCAERYLRDVELAVEHLNEGRETCYTELLYEAIEMLKHCGVEVSIE